MATTKRAKAKPKKVPDDTAAVWKLLDAEFTQLALTKAGKAEVKAIFDATIGHYLRRKAKAGIRVWPRTTQKGQKFRDFITRSANRIARRLSRDAGPTVTKAEVDATARYVMIHFKRKGCTADRLGDTNKGTGLHGDVCSAWLDGA